MVYLLLKFGFLKDVGDKKPGVIGNGSRRAPARVRPLLSAGGYAGMP